MLAIILCQRRQCKERCQFSPMAARPKLLNDPVYGFIQLRHADFTEIMDHPWFENLGWIAVQNGTLRPLHMFPEGHVTSNSDVLNRNENDGESDFSLGGKAEKFWLAEDGGNCSDSRQSGSAHSSFSGFADF